MLNDCLQVHIKFIHYFRRLFRQLKHQKKILWEEVEKNLFSESAASGHRNLPG
jgi:hypothetical protein